MTQERQKTEGSRAEAIYPDAEGTSGLSTEREQGFQAQLAFRSDDWSIFLQEMIRMAEAEWQRVLAGDAFRFSHLVIALKEIHRGSCRPLLCGSAASYVSVSAEGNYFTCHRTIDDSRFALGTLADGPSSAAREQFLQSSPSHPCDSCGCGMWD